MGENGTQKEAFGPMEVSRAIKKARILIASCLFLAASGITAWTADAGNPPAALLSPILSIEDENSAFNLSVEDFRLAPFQESFTPAIDEPDTALRGLQARYQLGPRGGSVELTGGYVPGMKSVARSEPQFYPDAYLGYVNLKIPVYRFYLSGGAFFGQNLDVLALTTQGPSDELGLQRSLFGYQVGGGYRFNDRLSIQAGWGQAAHEREFSRDDLRAWYFQAQISLGWRISITPQAGFVDFMKDDGERTKEEAFYCGARWQINF
jgi:hypothetical protein